MTDQSSRQAKVWMQVKSCFGFYKFFVVPYCLFLYAFLEIRGWCVRSKSLSGPRSDKGHSAQLQVGRGLIVTYNGILRLCHSYHRVYIDGVQILIQ